MSSLIYLNYAISELMKKEEKEGLTEEEEVLLLEIAIQQHPCSCPYDSDLIINKKIGDTLFSSEDNFYYEENNNYTIYRADVLYDMKDKIGSQLKVKEGKEVIKRAKEKENIYFKKLYKESGYSEQQVKEMEKEAYEINDYFPS